MTDNKELVKKLRAYAAQYEKYPFGREILGTPELMREAADALENFVKVVRCRDCKHKDEVSIAFIDNTDPALYCKKMGGIIAEMFYCADGTRKDGEENGR